jgi:hypothetical protein
MTPRLRWLSRINPFACGAGTDVVRRVALASLTWMLATPAHAQIASRRRARAGSMRSRVGWRCTAGWRGSDRDVNTGAEEETTR